MLHVSCDICHEIIKPTEQKCLISINVSPNGNRDLKEEEYKEMINAVFCDMLESSRTVPVYEICPKCLEVLYHFINVRRDELDNTKKLLKVMYSKKSKELKEKK